MFQAKPFMGMPIALGGMAVMRINVPKVVAFFETGPQGKC
jgi:hypothetical protein